MPGGGPHSLRRYRHTGKICIHTVALGVQLCREDFVLLTEMSEYLAHFLLHLPVLLFFLPSHLMRLVKITDLI